MARKSYKPVTPGQRHRKRLVGMESGLQLVPGNLSFGKKKSGGRNNRGRVTSFHRGGGFKQRLRTVAFKQAVVPQGQVEIGMVRGVQYDPNRTGYLALMEPLRSSVGERSEFETSNVHITKDAKQYRLAAEGVKVGDVLERGKGSALRVGNTMPLSEIPLGTERFNIEVQPGAGGKLVRSAGVKAVLLRKLEDGALVRLPSGERRRFALTCTATIGSVMGADHLLEVIGKAGRNRNRGRRPIVRGVAMNPIDHPHGGRTKGGVPTVTPQARVGKGQATRSKRKSSVFIVKSRKDKG